MAEAVEKVVEVKIFETMIQNSGLLRINIAASAAHMNDSYAKFDGPDFFNSLSDRRKCPNARICDRCTAAAVHGPR